MAFATPSAGSALNSPSHSLLHRQFDIDTAASAQSMVIDSAGKVGIGTASPTGILTISNNNWIAARNAADSAGINMFKVNASDTIDVGAALNVGTIALTEDSGDVTLVNLPVSGAAADGTSESYSFAIDSEAILQVKALSDGTGGIDTKSVVINGDLGLTGTRITKGWFTDLQVTNAIAGSVTGNAATATDTAAKTGTGSTYATNTSPTFTTPDIGTPSAGTLTSCTGLPAAGVTNTAVTLTDTQALTNKSIGTDGTISALTLTEKASIALDPAGGADGDYSGITIAGTAGATLAFGDVVYLAVADSKWELTDASAVATAKGMVGICVLAGNADAATTILLSGTVRADTAFPTLTVGAPVYMSETAGDVVVTAPTTTDAVVRVLGFALTANEMYWDCSPDYLTVT